MSLIELKNVTKKYGDKVILDNISLNIEAGEFVGIKGESGKGKTTLLNVIGLVEDCTGEVKIDGEVVKYKERKKVQKLLRDRIGYLFQNFALIDDVTVYENLKIVMPKANKEELRKQMEEALVTVGLSGEYIDKQVCKLSGGEQQRVAAARIILKKCDIILADEPTGSLDVKNAQNIMYILKKLQMEGKTVIMVSHDERLFGLCSRVIEL